MNKVLQAQNIVKVGLRGLGMHYSDEYLPRDRKTVCAGGGGREFVSEKCADLSRKHLAAGRLTCIHDEAVITVGSLVIY